MSTVARRAEATPDIGKAMYRLIERLYPICRSITGDGVRESLAIVGEHVPLQVHEVPSGTPVLDWTVPKEWNIRDAYVKDASGRRVIDFRRSNLHVLGYSAPVRRRMSLAELRPHLHTLPDYPDWIPYRTSYYKENWGFCLAHNALRALPDGEYEVVIDSTLTDGALTYGELVLPGEQQEEFLLSCHVCHPSMCNDNLSGIALATFLATRLAARRARRYTYRFLFIPGTIGSITWLARNEQSAKRVRHGLVINCVGDGGPFNYKRSRRGDAEIDRAAANVLRHCGRAHDVFDFFPYGYDERQYCSPGFDMPVGALSRTTHGHYPQYHTSADDLGFVRPEPLAESLELYETVIDAIEQNRRYRNLNPKGEPQLGRRGLYGAFGAGMRSEDEMAVFWVLNLSDGEHDLLGVAERAGMPFATIARAAAALRDTGLLAAE